MSIILIVSPDIEQQTLLLQNVKVDVLVTYNVTRETLKSYSRIGFLYHQTDTFPFVLDDDNEHIPGENLYFNNQWLTFFTEETKIVDLLSCEYHTDLYEYTKFREFQTVLNYSTDTTGNTPIGDWILEKSIQGNVNISVEIYVKDIYFTEGINEWNVYLSSVYNSIVINTSGKVYASNGRIPGLGQTYYLELISKLHNNSDYDISKEFFIATNCGVSHALFLTIDGSVYACGKNTYGEFGNGETDSNGGAAKITISGEHIVSFSCGVNFSVFLTKTGKVFSCGRNVHGQLGHGNTENVYKPTLISYFSNNNINIKAIECGHYNTFFLDTSGKVYSCGYNNYVQAGHPGYIDEHEPTLINSLSGEQIISVSASLVHTLFLNSDKQVYGCGQTIYSGASSRNPVLITSLSDKKIISVSAGGRHSIFLTEEGKVYSCGFADFIGRSTTTNNIDLIDDSIFTNKTIIAIIANYQHTLLLDWFGKVYSFGYNEYGHLGLGDSESRNTPTLIETYKNGTTDINYAYNPISTLMDSVNNKDYVYSADVCFPGDTPIQVDQGTFKIRDIDPKKHTLNKKKIRYITQTKLKHQKELIMFEKGALGKNVPSQNTVMTKDHAVYYSGKLINAKYFTLWNKKVKEVKYNGETLYNVSLRTHEKMKVNGMVVETLHPSHDIVKAYELMESTEDELEKVRIVRMINEEYNNKVFADSIKERNAVQS
jgi:alpha-tubulin suppressor-like RCC1 family protein